MPNLTFYIDENYSENFKEIGDFTDKCRTLCCNVLGAEPKNVHIIFINIKPGCGRPIYAELFYRLTTLRTNEIMEGFMRELDFAIQQAFGLKARIRCFGSPEAHLFALN